MDQVDFYAPLTAPFLYETPENFERLISESLSYRSAIIMSRRLKTLNSGQWMPGSGQRLVKK
jgi:hypothetical protein